MPNINFDGVPRRDAKEPQITKTQLLEPLHHSVSGADWETPRTPRGIYGVGDLVTNGASWDFGALAAPDTSETPSDSSKAPVKQELATPAPDPAQYGSDGDHDRLAARNKGGDSQDTLGRPESGTSSDDQYGRQSGVIDLTGDDSDDEKDMAMPERQFVPRAEHDSTASSFPRQKAATPPRTFTKGLEPIAAHPRKPPVVHRQKPPIKPAGRQRKTVSASPSPAVSASQGIFATKRRRMLSTQPTDFRFGGTSDRSSSTVRTLECTPLGYSTDSMDQTPGREANPVEDTNANQETAHIPSAPKNPSGPFVEVDDSSNDEQRVAAAPRKKYSRDSMTRFIGRPRNDTPIRSMQNDIVEQSRALRAQAHKRTQDGQTTRSNTMAPGAGDADVDMIDEQAFLGLPRRMGMP